LIYWRGGDYVGIGPGAHGRVSVNGSRVATSTALEPVKWLRAVETVGTGENNRAQISPEDQLIEYVMMSLRLREGLDTDLLSTFPRHDEIFSNIQKLEDQGYLMTERNRVSVQPEYRILLNAVLRELLI
jgi:coproporphyrinogen III oxidase-like Fe-S oxidoreductase